jgi:hypothetical protein
MTVVDFHPDDLLDRDAKGLLARDEQKRLQEHLSRCAVCRLELQLRQDFRAEFAPYEEATSVQRFVIDALSAASTRRELSAEATGASVDIEQLAPSRRRWQRNLIAPLASMLLLVTGFAAAQSTGLVGSVLALAERALGVQPATTSTPQAESVRASRNAQSSTGSRGPRAVRELDPTQVAAPESSSASTEKPSVATRQDDKSGTVRSRSRRDTTAAPVPVPQSAKDRHSSSAESSAASPKASTANQSPTTGAPFAPEGELLRSAASKLFAQANLARRQGHWLEASGLYRELRARYGESPEARLSLVVLARMQLDHGEANAALRGFDSYLALSDEALREEALTGRCLALQKLGRSEEERAAVRHLLATYPDSPYARKAAKRLGAEARE